MSLDVASVLNSLDRKSLSLEIASERVDMPQWADWLIWLGQWMRIQATLNGRRVAVVRVPTRRFAAAFVGLGAVFAAARMHDDSLDWDAIKSLSMGTIVHWRQITGSRSIGYSGRVAEGRVIGDQEYIAVAVDSPRKSKGSTFLLPRATALSYGVTLGAITGRVDERLSSAARLLKDVVEGASLSWVRSPLVDSTLVTERTSFVNDLADVGLRAGEGPAIALLDALAITDQSQRQQGKLLLLSSRSDGMDDSSLGLTILDGASAAARLGYPCANSVVVLLAHSEYSEEIVQSINSFVSHSIDGCIYPPRDGVRTAPNGIDVFVFGLPSAGQGGG